MNGFNLTFITENSLCVVMVMILTPFLQLVVFLKDLFLGLCYSCYMLMTYLTHQVCLLFTYLLMTITSIIHARTLMIMSQSNFKNYLILFHPKEY